MKEQQPTSQSTIPTIPGIEVELAMRNQPTEGDQRIEALREWKAAHRSEIRYMGQY